MLPIIQLHTLTQITLYFLNRHFLIQPFNTHYSFIKLCKNVTINYFVIYYLELGSKVCFYNADFEFIFSNRKSEKELNKFFYIISKLYSINIIIFGSVAFNLTQFLAKHDAAAIHIYINTPIHRYL